MSLYYSGVQGCPRLGKSAKWRFWWIWRFLVIFRDLGVAFATFTSGPEGVGWCHWHRLGMRYDKKNKNWQFFRKTFFFDEIFFSKKNQNRKFSKMVEISTKVTFFFDHFFRFSKIDILFSKIFGFWFFFGKFFLIEKKVFRKFFHFFIFFIISNPQPLHVASRNSPCAARGRGKRIPEFPKILENPPKSLI